MIHEGLDVHSLFCGPFPRRLFLVIAVGPQADPRVLTTTRPPHASPPLPPPLPMAQPFLVELMLLMLIMLEEGLLVRLVTIEVQMEDEEGGMVLTAQELQREQQGEAMV